MTKLFHIVRPDAAVFGEKDFQQLAIIRRMVRDLDFKIDILGVPTVREEDGLALSSRNQYLSADERKQAVALRNALLEARRLFREGKTNSGELLRAIRKTIQQAPLARVDYAEIVDAETLQPLENARAGALAAVAVFFGKTRLIDNILLR